MKSSTHGFTLIELVVTMAIVAILAALAGPSFSSLIQRNRVSSGANQLLGAMMLTRSEAIRANDQVVMCKTDRTDEANMACVGGASWNDGVLVFVDSVRDGTYSKGEEILRVLVPLNRSVEITSDALIKAAIGYNPSGLLAVPAALTAGGSEEAFTITAGENTATVSISPTGRARVEAE